MLPSYLCTCDHAVYVTAVYGGVSVHCGSCRQHQFLCGWVLFFVHTGRRISMTHFQIYLDPIAWCSHHRKIVTTVQASAHLWLAGGQKDFKLSIIPCMWVIASMPVQLIKCHEHTAFLRTLLPTVYAQLHFVICCITWGQLLTHGQTSWSNLKKSVSVTMSIMWCRSMQLIFRLSHWRLLQS